jgi:drug/metabolite transporter (DMT)-like permease
MPDAGPLGPGAAVIALGLTSAVLWGAADFGGGLTSRRAPLFGVVLGVQVVGAVLAGSLFLIRGEPIPAPVDVGWSVATGVFGAIGVTTLYQGLAVGRMGVVAPVTGVLAATIPVTVGIVTEGLPDPLVIGGIALAVVAVVLVSRVPGEHGQRSGLELGLAAGIGIGLFNTTLAQVDRSVAFGPLTIVRIVDFVLVGAFVLLTRGSWRIERRVLPSVGLVGIFDIGGNTAYLLATHAGALAIAATLSALYPVTTVVLAVALLRERMTSDHAVGVGAAIGAIALIALGRG